MDIQSSIITPEQSENAARLRDEYMAAARRSRSAMDRALAAGYKALASGSSILDLFDVMKKIGVHESTFLPKLAIVRADFKTAHFERKNHGAAVMAGTDHFLRRKSFQGKPANGARIEFPEHTFLQPQEVMGAQNPPRYWWSHQAPVPLIPPHLRPADAYSHYHILWEVEEWQPVAPRDPLLLRHLTGSLYVVVAQWNLTSLERIVMNQMLVSGGNQ